MGRRKDSHTILMQLLLYSVLSPILFAAVLMFNEKLEGSGETGVVLYANMSLISSHNIASLRKSGRVFSDKRKLEGSMKPTLVLR